MVNIVMTGMCEDCYCAELVLDSLDFSGERKWSVSCEKQDACERIERQTVKRFAEKYGVDE